MKWHIEDEQFQFQDEQFQFQNDQFQLQFQFPDEQFQIQFQFRQVLKWTIPSPIPIPELELIYEQFQFQFRNWPHLCLYIVSPYPRAPNVVSFALRPVVFEIQGWRKSELHGMTPDWPKTLNCLKYFVYTKYLHPYTTPPKTQIWTVSPNDQPFSRYQENRKCTEWSQNDRNHLTVRSTLYILSTYSRSPNFGQFRSMVRHFRDTKILKNRKNQKCTDWPQPYLEHLTVKRTMYTLNAYPCTNLAHFALWLAVSG